MDGCKNPREESVVSKGTCKSFLELATRGPRKLSPEARMLTRALTDDAYSMSRMCIIWLRITRFVCHDFAAKLFIPQLLSFLVSLESLQPLAHPLILTELRMCSSESTSACKVANLYTLIVSPDESFLQYRLISSYYL